MRLYIFERKRFLFVFLLGQSSVVVFVVVCHGLVIIFKRWDTVVLVFFLAVLGSETLSWAEADDGVFQLWGALASQEQTIHTISKLVTYSPQWWWQSENDDDSHSRFSAVLIEVSIGLTSKLSDLLDCVRVHGFWGAAHDTISVSFPADLPFPTSILSHCVGLCHRANLRWYIDPNKESFLCFMKANLPVVPFARGGIDVHRVIEVPNYTKTTYDAANSTSTSKDWAG